MEHVLKVFNFVLARGLFTFCDVGQELFEVDKLLGFWSILVIVYNSLMNWEWRAGRDSG